jgi:penicillin-binding protein 2
MAVMTAAVANGGQVFFPRLVADIVPQDAFVSGKRVSYPAGRLRDNLGVRPASLQVVREAMLADTEDPEGTAFKAFHETSSGGPRLKSFRVAAKTGTAQVEDQSGRTTDHITWFVSFGPYENPRYAVVVMVESGGSGGTTCAPVARDIYQFLEEMERQALERKSRAVSVEWKRDADRDASGPVLAEARPPVVGSHDILHAIQ